jgi:GT2 family glycosyltransferase
MSESGPVIALPVKDEAESLPACLRALTEQNAAERPIVLVLVNNSSDSSAAVARAFAANGPCRVIVEKVVLPGRQASAGGARRVAMDMAADLAGSRGIILTTDADGRARPNWLRANLAAIRTGADAVAGRAVIDPVDEARIPPALIEADALECRYAALLDEIAATIDPDPVDPWPRHDAHSGASIAVTVDAFRRAGGIPDLAMGEDRAFFQRLRRIDADIRHDPDVSVLVSGRTEGRAIGGMADTIRRRLVCPDLFLDDRLEGAAQATLRARLRRCARNVWRVGAAENGAVRALASALHLPSCDVRDLLSGRFFGAAWENLETASPILGRRPVRAASVGTEISRAGSILAELRESLHETNPAKLRVSDGPLPQGEGRRKARFSPPLAGARGFSYVMLPLQRAFGLGEWR